MNELLEICTQFRRGILGRKSSKWMCFAVSAPLQCYLNQLGYPARLIAGEVISKDYTMNHYWIEIEDLIVDPTADQFNSLFNQKMPQVYIGEKPEWYHKENI